MTAWLALWWMKLLAGAAIVLGFWWAVHAYNTKITKAAVIEAKAEVTAIYKPKFDGLTKQFNDLQTNVIQSRLAAKSAADLLLAQEKLNASIKTSRYQSEIAALKTVASKRDADRAADLTGFDLRLLSVTKTLAPGDGSGSSGVRLSGYTNELAGLYSQCERDLGEAISTATEAVDRASSAEAAARALSP